MNDDRQRLASDSDLTGAQWRKSSHSSGNGACVEVAFTSSTVALRDTKDRRRPLLLLSFPAWHIFVHATADSTLTGVAE